MHSEKRSEKWIKTGCSFLTAEEFTAAAAAERSQASALLTIWASILSTGERSWSAVRGVSELFPNSAERG